MFLKSLVIASSAAILAPILGVFLFVGIYAFETVPPAITGVSAPYKNWRMLPNNEPDSSRSLSTPPLRPTATEASTLLREAKQKAVVFGPWLTTTYCADGKPVFKQGDCDRPNHIGVANNFELADTLTDSKAALTPCFERKNLSRHSQTVHRMTLGGPISKMSDIWHQNREHFVSDGARI